MSDSRWPVIEVFGPTVQGEGPEAGMPCHFIRFGGCDFRCSWCDSMYAVEPKEVRAHAEQLGVEQLRERIAALPGRSAKWIILSGGNPALHELGPLVTALQNDCGFQVAIETQGSRWKPWLAQVDRLTVSPKPPSSGMASPVHGRAFNTFMGEVAEAGRLFDTAMKIVVSDDTDYEWAKRIFAMYPTGEQHMSVCTPQPGEGDWEGQYPMDQNGNLILEVADRYAQLAERVAQDPDLTNVRVLPQLHVIAWGAARGV